MVDGLSFREIVLIIFWLIFFISIYGKKFPNKWARLHEATYGKPPNTFWEIFGKLIFLIGFIYTFVYLFF